LVALVAFALRSTLVALVAVTLRSALVALVAVTLRSALVALIAFALRSALVSLALRRSARRVGRRLPTGFRPPFAGGCLTPLDRLIGLCMRSLLGSPAFVGGCFLGTRALPFLRRCDLGTCNEPGDRDCG
jgi:hypothetical protein